MDNKEKQSKKKNNSEVKGFLKTVEVVGNKLPHPAMIFLSFCVLIIALSAVFAGKSVTYYDAKAGTDATAEIISLLNWEGLRHILGNMTTNFTEFPALGTVLIAMLGVGVAEKTGLINTFLKKLMTGVNPTFMTAIVVFAGIVSNVASDAGYVVVVPLGAIIFANAGRHPIAGLAAAFAGVSAGFSANLILGTTDPLLAGITNVALEGANIDVRIAPTANWYFMIVSTFLLTFLGTFVTERIVEKNLGKYTGSYMPDKEEVSALEQKGLNRAGIALLLFFVVLGLLLIPENAPLKTPELIDGVEVMTTKWFLHNALIPVIFLGFLIPGLVFGKVVGTVKTSFDVVGYMVDAMKSMSSLLVLVFFISQFVNYFKYTNMGTVISVKGAEGLERIGLTGLPLIIGFVIVSAFINLFMGGASSKWAIMAPIFVPMMYELGLSPEITQVAFRIGDSTTNVITPLMSYFAMIVVFMQKYDEESGLGTLISTMLPYSVVFLIGWTLLLVLWYVFNLPLGPGAYIFV